MFMLTYVMVRIRFAGWRAFSETNVSPFRKPDFPESVYIELTVVSAAPPSGGKSWFHKGNTLDLGNRRILGTVSFGMVCAGC